MNNRICIIIKCLEKTYPVQRSLLLWETPWQLTAAVMLSARTTDAGVNKVTPLLFSRWPEPESMSRADLKEIEKIVHPLGFYRQKAKHLIDAAGKIISDFNGRVPESFNDLTSLPGIGRKSANVIRAHVWGLPAVIVDTHFSRVCRRLGLTESRNAEIIEDELKHIIPEKHQTHFSMAVNYHGRDICTSRNPDCSRCVVKDLCPSAVSLNKA